MWCLSKKNQPIISILEQTGLGKIKPCTDLFKKDKGIYYFQTKEIIIQNPELAPVHVGGEPIEIKDKIEIKIFPGAFKRIQPY